MAHRPKWKWWPSSQEYCKLQENPKKKRESAYAKYYLRKEVQVNRLEYLLVI